MIWGPERGQPARTERSCCCGRMLAAIGIVVALSDCLKPWDSVPVPFRVQGLPGTNYGAQCRLLGHWGSDVLLGSCECRRKGRTCASWSAGTLRGLLHRAASVIQGHPA